MQALRAGLLALLALFALVAVASVAQATPTVSGFHAVLAGEVTEVFAFGDGSAPFTLSSNPPIAAIDHACAPCTEFGEAVFVAPGGVSQIIVTATDAGGSATTVTHVYASADWAVGLSPSALTLTEGDAAKTVTLTVTNHGLSAVAGTAVLRVTDAAHVTGDCAATGSGTLTAICNVPSLASGASKSFTFQLAYDHAGAGPLEAAARPGDTSGVQTLVSSIDPNLANNYYAGAVSAVAAADTHTPTATPTPTVTPTTGGTSPTPSETTTAPPKPLTISLSPISGAQTKGSALAIAYTVHNPESNARVGGAALSFGGRLLTASQATFAAGDTAGHFDITVPASDGTLVATVADAAGSSSASTPLTIAQPLFHVFLLGPSTGSAGETVGYTVSVRNDGSAPGSDTVTLTLPAGYPTETNSLCEAGDSTITFCSGTLAPGATQNLGEFGFALGAAGTQAIVSGTDTYGTPVSITTTIGAASTNLIFDSFSASDGSPHDGQDVAITIVLRNDGNVGITDAFVEIPLPGGLSPGDTARSPCPIVNGSAHCALGAIPAHGSITRVFHVTASTGDYSVTATAGSSVTDTNSGDNSKSLHMSVSPS